MDAFAPSTPAPSPSPVPSLFPVAPVLSAPLCGGFGFRSPLPPRSWVALVPLGSAAACPRFDSSPDSRGSSSLARSLISPGRCCAPLLSAPDRFFRVHVACGPSAPLPPSLHFAFRRCTFAYSCRPPVSPPAPQCLQFWLASAGTCRFRMLLEALIASASPRGLFCRLSPGLPAPGKAFFPLPSPRCLALFLPTFALVGFPRVFVRSPLRHSSGLQLLVCVGLFPRPRTWVHCSTASSGPHPVSLAFSAAAFSLPRVASWPFWVRSCFKATPLGSLTPSAVFRDPWLVRSYLFSTWNCLCPLGGRAMTNSNALC